VTPAKGFCSLWLLHPLVQFVQFISFKWWPPSTITGGERNGRGRHAFSILLELAVSRYGGCDFLWIFYDLWRESVLVMWSPRKEVKLALCCFCDFWASARCILPLAGDSGSQSGLPGAMVAEFVSRVLLRYLGFWDFYQWQSIVRCSDCYFVHICKFFLGVRCGNRNWHWHSLFRASCRAMWFVSVCSTPLSVTSHRSDLLPAWSQTIFI
jgi:hypothetical protein